MFVTEDGREHHCGPYCEHPGQNGVRELGVRRCEWWIKSERRRCGKPAEWLFEPRLDRAVCDKHAQSWMRRGQTFAKLVGFAEAAR